MTDIDTFPKMGFDNRKVRREHGVIDSGSSAVGEEKGCCVGGIDEKWEGRGCQKVITSEFSKGPVLSKSNEIALLSYVEVSFRIIYQLKDLICFTLLTTM